MIILKIIIGLSYIVAIILYRRNKKEIQNLKKNLSTADKNFNEFIEVFTTDRKTIRTYFDTIQNLKKEINRISKENSDKLNEINKDFRELKAKKF